MSQKRKMVAVPDLTPSPEGVTSNQLDTSFSGPPYASTIESGLSSLHHYAAQEEPTMKGIVKRAENESARSLEPDVILMIDVIPTSSCKRCYAASVALRGTVDNEV